MYHHTQSSPFLEEIYIPQVSQCDHILDPRHVGKLDHFVRQPPKPIV